MEDQRLDYGEECDCPSCGGVASPRPRAHRDVGLRIASPGPVVSLKPELEVLLNIERMTYEQWARATGDRVIGFNRRANALVAAGYVVFRDGFYSVTGAGRAAAGDPADQLLLQLV